MGTFWWSAAPWSIVKATFLARAYNTAVSGLEAMVLTATDLRVISNVALGYLKVLLRGKVDGKSEDEEGNVTYKAMKTKDKVVVKGKAMARP